jgi:hypothetical protein
MSFSTSASVFANVPEHAQQGGPSPQRQPQQQQPQPQPRPSSGRPLGRESYSARRHSESAMLGKGSPALTEQTSSEADVSVIATKLIYTEQKLFWQIKGTIDFHLFEHIGSEPCILELAPCFLETGAELDHIYLNKALILPRVQAEVQRRLEQKQAALKPVRSRSGKLQSLQSASGERESAPDASPGLADRSALVADCSDLPAVPSSDDIIIQDLTNKAIGEFVLARILVDDSADRLTVRVKQTSSEVSDPTKLSIVVDKPDGKSNLAIKRSRRPSFVEFGNVLQIFKSNSEDLQHAMSDAAVFRSKSTEAFDKFKEMNAVPRAVSVEELQKIEVAHCKPKEEKILTGNERYKVTVNTINAHKLPGDTASPSACDARANSRPSSPASRRSRAGRETFPNPGRPLSPGHPRPASMLLAWNQGTRASPLRQTRSPGSRSSSPSPGKLPPRPMWNSGNSSPTQNSQPMSPPLQPQPQRRRSDVSLVGIASRDCSSPSASPLLVAKSSPTLI